VVVARVVSEGSASILALAFLSVILREAEDLLLSFAGNTTFPLDNQRKAKLELCNRA
jgi:hypothetical protein